MREKKVILRKRQGETVRLETDRQTLINSIMSQVSGQKVSLVKTPKEVKETLYKESDFERPLTDRQRESMYNYFLTLVRESDSFQDLGDFQTDYKKTEKVFCLNCKKRLTFRHFYFKKFCDFCKSDRLEVKTEVRDFLYFNNYKRVCLVWSKSEVWYQIEINSGSYNKSFKTVLRGQMSRGIK